MHHGQFPNIALTEKNNETFKKGWAYLDGEEEMGVVVLLNFFFFPKFMSKFHLDPELRLFDFQL